LINRKIGGIEAKHKAEMKHALIKILVTLLFEFLSIGRRSKNNKNKQC
jgi:hypothetical protein